MQLQSVILLLLVSAAAHQDACGLPDTSSAYRRAAARRGQPPGTFEVSFSYDEESLLRSQQGDTAEMIAQRMRDKSPTQIQRRCAELGLRCGGKQTPPEKNSEQWRRVTRP